MKNIYRKSLLVSGCTLALIGTSLVSHAADAPKAKEAPKAKHSKLKAKITEEQAKAAALAAKPGKVTEVELEKEDGVVVYGVDVTAEDGKLFDVTVDANTGKVLKVEAEDAKEKDEKDGKK